MPGTNPEEAKRSELINELLSRHEPLIARAVESASGCYFKDGHLFLQYQDALLNSWPKVLTDAKQSPRLSAAARRVGIEVHILSMSVCG
jgi:hypothetical protein